MTATSYDALGWVRVLGVMEVRRGALPGEAIPSFRGRYT